MNYKLIIPFLSLACLLGCATTQAEDVVEDVTEEVISSPTPVYTPTPASSDTPDPSVDYDLSVMSSTMIFSQVYDLLSNGDNYKGTTFKIAGTYTFYEYPETGTYYFIVINDALGCCAQGIDIRFPEDMEIPDAFGDVIIKGTIGTELINDYDYTFVYIDITEFEYID